jgi:alpha-mannosidase
MCLIRRSILSIFIAILSAVSTGHAAVEVKTEQINPASPTWSFKTIPGPSRSDAAASARVTVIGNETDEQSAPATALVDGHVPAKSGDLSQCVFLSNANARSGGFLIDLGKVQSIAAVNSYSWHEFAADQGARGPQVYTLYGSTAGHPDPADLGASDWVKIADVDSRPNKTGDHWNGQYGVNITDTTGLIGNFRYLLLAVQATHSPRQPNAAWTNTMFDEIDVHTPETLAKAGDALIGGKDTQVTDIWVAFKTHFDLGYTDLAANVRTKYRVSMMDIALKNFEANRTLPPNERFVWTLPGWPLAYILGPEQDAARREKIIQAVREGSLVGHAMPASIHTESLDLEDLVRGMGFASKVARQYGRPLPIAAKMTDVPCHSWVLPTLLTHAGVKFLQIGTNEASQYGRFPKLFWWEGPDGSRILCNPTPYYGSGLTPPAGWPAKNYLAMIMTYDNHGPPSPGDLDALRKKAARELPGVRIHFGTMDDFANAVLAEKPELPVVRGDTPDTWIHGLLSMPDATKIARDIRPMESALEALDTHLHSYGLTTASLAAPLADAYENSMLYGEHTFGMNGAFGGRGIWGLDEWKKRMPKDHQQKFLQSFEDKRNYIRKTEAIVNRELDSRLDLLAHSINTNGRRIVVWNPLPWPRSGIVTVPDAASRPAAVQEPGIEKTQSLENGTFLASDVPANGYKTYLCVGQTSLVPVAGADISTAFETPFYRVTFDLQRGGITSLVEKHTGRELADTTSPYALGQFLHERFSQNEVNRWLTSYPRFRGGWAEEDFGKPGMPGPDKSPYAAITPDHWTISVRHWPDADVAMLTAGDTKDLAKSCTLTFTFPRHAPLVDVDWRVTDKTPNKIPEGGWLCFPLAIEKPRFTVGRPGGPIDPATDIVAGGNRHLMAVASGVTIAGADNIGTSICPIDSPDISLDQPGLWKFSMDFVPRKPAVFVNLYNNMWNTNFPLWVDGSWSERVRLWPTADLVAPSWEARVPLLTAFADGPAGKLPVTQAGLTVSRPGVLLTAFGADPDGINKGTLLRVWDQTGSSGPLTIKLPAGCRAATATPVDLRGQNAGPPVVVTDGAFTFDLHAYAPATFILE